MMAENLNNQTRSRVFMGHMNKWDVIDKLIRLIVYAAIAYLLWKMFHVAVP